jgi:hypothetical protein
MKPIDIEDLKQVIDRFITHRKMHGTPTFKLEL